MLNQTTISNLIEIDKDSGGGFLEEMVGLFLNQTDLLLTSLRTHITQWEPTQVEASAHKLKGSSLNLGADHLAGLSNQLENYGRDNTPSDSTEILNQLEAEVRQVREELQAILVKLA